MTPQNINIRDETAAPSAFIVNHDHIKAIITGFARFHYDRPSRAEATELGQLLLIENSRSVASVAVCSAQPSPAVIVAPVTANVPPPK